MEIASVATARRFHYYGLPSLPFRGHLCCGCQTGTRFGMRMQRQRQRQRWRESARDTPLRVRRTCADLGMGVKDVRPALAEKFEKVSQEAGAPASDAAKNAAQALSEAPDVKDRNQGEGVETIGQ